MRKLNEEMTRDVLSTYILFRASGLTEVRLCQKFTCVDSCKQSYSLQRTVRRAADISIVKVLKRDMQIATNGFIGFDLLSTVIVQMSSDVPPFSIGQRRRRFPERGFPRRVSSFFGWIVSSVCFLSGD